MIDFPTPEADLSLRALGTPLDTEQRSGFNKTEPGNLTFMVLREPG